MFEAVAAAARGAWLPTPPTRSAGDDTEVEDLPPPPGQPYRRWRGRSSARSGLGDIAVTAVRRVVPFGGAFADADADEPATPFAGRRPTAATVRRAGEAYRSVLALRRDSPNR